MRIGIDARELCGKPTGVGRYLRWLLAEWAANDYARGHEFVLYAPTLPPLTLDARRFGSRIVAGRLGAWWEQAALPTKIARDHVDVFFSPGYTAPLALSIPTVVAIHDLSFFAHPEWFHVREGLRRRWLTYQSAMRAHTVVTISEFSRREIVERLGLPPDRIRVIRPGTFVARAALDRTSPRVLFVGSIFNRRRVPDLIRAFAHVAQASARAHLDIVGDNRSFPREDLGALIHTAGLADRATWRSYVTDDELQTLYGEARAFAFLSEYEGLGLTPLEALAAGVPPVLLDTPIARESCQDAALYVQLGDVRGTARALELLLFDQATRSRLLAASPRVLASFDGRAAARETLCAITCAAAS